MDVQREQVSTMQTRGLSDTCSQQGSKSRNIKGLKLNRNKEENDTTGLTETKSYHLLVPGQNSF